MDRKAVIVSAVRTPFGKFGGKMKDIPSPELAAYAMKDVLGRVGVNPVEVEEVYYGTCILAENALQQNVMARQALLKAGYPAHVLSMTIDRACCSSSTALILGYKSIMNGDASTVVAVGSDNMSRVPFLVMEPRWGNRLGNIVMEDILFELGYKEWNPVSVDAGEVALEEGVSREEQDMWALRTQKRYAEASQAGKFREEIVPFKFKSGREEITIEQDESPRPDITMEQLAKLKTVYGSPTVTAGNAPGLTTGSTAALIMSEEKALSMGLKPLAYITGAQSVALEPRYIAKAPAVAIEKLLDKKGKSISDIDLIEINEAFAAMPLVSSKIMAKNDPQMTENIRNKINVNGGAIAIGHPVGASGLRIAMTLMYELARRGGGTGVAAICGGLAQGDAVMIEVVK